MSGTTGTIKVTQSSMFCSSRNAVMAGVSMVLEQMELLFLLKVKNMRFIKLRNVKSSNMEIKSFGIRLVPVPLWLKRLISRHYRRFLALFHFVPLVPLKKGDKS